MSKEIVNLNLENTTGRLPYNLYYRNRNGNTARELARYFSLPYQEEDKGEFRREAVYTVPAVTLDSNRTKSFLAEAIEDFYGTRVEHLGHVGKAILHPLIGEANSKFYSVEFAKCVADYTLPGFSFFTVEAGSEAFRRLCGQEARLKLTTESDGHGQFVITNETELLRTLDKFDPTKINEEGLILEPNLREPFTISVGYTILGSVPYSFVAHQKNDVTLDDRNRYLGAHVLVLKGTLGDLSKLVSLSEDEQEAIAKACRFNEAYAYLNPIASRLSFDCLFGQTQRGERLSGITDITGRLGGTCPALTLAANKLKTRPFGSTTLAEVSLNYNPTGDLASYEEEAVVFLDHSTLRLTAKTK